MISYFGLIDLKNRVIVASRRIENNLEYKTDIRQNGENARK